jgi:hypothetical protein
MTTVAIRPDEQNRVLEAEPVERLLARLKCDAAAAAGFRRTLEAMGSECRALARGDGQLRHLLVVRVRQDPDWRRWTAVRYAPAGAGLWRLRLPGAAGSNPEFGLMGWYYDGRHATPDAAFEMAYRRMASEVVRALEGLIGCWERGHKLDPVACWTLDLYRSAWASSPSPGSPAAHPMRCSQHPLGAARPSRGRGRLARMDPDHGEVPQPRSRGPELLVLVGGTGCVLGLGDEDRHDPRRARTHASPAPPRTWRDADWIEHAVNDRTLGERLRKAGTKNKHKRVECRSNGRCYEYELGSFCGYLPNTVGRSWPRCGEEGQLLGDAAFLSSAGAGAPRRPTGK